MDEMKVLLEFADTPQQCNIDVYESNGGYRAIRKALKELQPSQLIDLVKTSGLRGRGGAGFVTGLKWSFVPKDNSAPKYVVCNCDESEPGTFKDRLLIEKDPHQLIEGVMLASYAIEAHTSFIYCRGEYYEGIEKLQKAVNEAYQKGYLGKSIFGSDYSLDIIVHPGAGAYIAGEETAQLNSLEGYRATPRLKPPFPAVAGLYGKPTIINNVETLCSVVHIVNRGSDWFKSIGTPKSTGTKIFQVSGHVQKPGCYEFPIGVTLRTVIDKAGGMLPGKSFKACYPGGSSCALITAKHIDIAMDFETLAALKSSFGTASLIVMDDTTDMVKVAHRLMEFYQNESCGKCTPCREGTRWVVQILERILKGKGVYKDLETIKQVSNFMALNSFCPLAAGAAPPIVSAVQEFEEEFLTYIRKNPDADKTPKQLVVYPYV
jgi:NADH-quinone oxidoreductase subunit F